MTSGQKKAVLLDYGGVLTTPITDSFTAFCETEGIELDLFRSVMQATARTADSPFAKVERGAMTEEEFDAAVAVLLSDRCGRSIPADGLKQRMFARVQPDPAMHDAVRVARAAGVGTVLVSNSWGGRGYPLDNLNEIFDAIVISGHIGMRKPDPDIYLFAAGKAAVPPDACIFVDDFNVNVEGAEAVGMTGILHRDAETTIEQLEGLLGISLRSRA